MSPITIALSPYKCNAGTAKVSVDRIFYSSDSQKGPAAAAFFLARSAPSLVLARIFRALLTSRFSFCVVWHSLCTPFSMRGVCFLLNAVWHAAVSLNKPVLRLMSRLFRRSRSASSGYTNFSFLRCSGYGPCMSLLSTAQV